jgi:hypothetical protein
MVSIYFIGDGFVCASRGILRPRTSPNGEGINTLLNRKKIMDFIPKAREKSLNFEKKLFSFAGCLS